MKSKHAFYTKTLTDLYEKQGYYEESQNGLRALIQNEPGREEYAHALAGLEEKIRHNRKKKLVGLVTEWVNLLRDP